MLWIFYHKLKRPGSRVDLVQNCTRLPLDQTKELDNPAFFAIIARVKRIESCLFDNPKSKARAGLPARTTALSIRVHSPGLFKETNS